MVKKFKRNLYRKKRPPKKKKRRSKKRFTSKADKALLRDWSRTVRERDSFTCRSCGSKKNSHAHHMVSKYYVPEYTLLLENGITLCKVCHLGERGVHGKGRALNRFITKLRRIYKMHNIKEAVKLNK